MPFLLSSAALTPSCAPGGNFDLSVWELQLPSGPTSSPGSLTTISPSTLGTTCSGYEDFDWFFGESGDGAMVSNLGNPLEYEIKKEQVMKAPSPSSSNCVPTTGSVHCRTEFHEVASWSPGSSTNRLYVDLTVTTVADSSICIGQVFNNDGTSKPVAEIYYSSNGQISIGVEHTAAGGTQGTPTPIKSVPVGTRFNFGRHSKSPFNAPYSFSMLGSR